MLNPTASTRAAAALRRLTCNQSAGLVIGLSLTVLATASAGAEPPTEQLELRDQQANQSFNLRLEQNQLRVPDAADKQRAELRLRQERVRQDQLHQRQQADSAVLRQEQRVAPLPVPEAGVERRSQRRLYQQQNDGQRLQFRLNRRY